MDLSTLLGLLSGIIFIVVGIYLDGSLSNFFDVPSIMITFGGTVAATLINFPFSQLIDVCKAIKMVFNEKKNDVHEGIDQILRLALVARRDGILALENHTEEINSDFVKKGIMLIVDGTSPEIVKNMMETELAFIEERHERNQNVLTSMAQYAPAFGMIGTLIGLINMLKNLNDVEAIGPSMAVALVTTFYGVILANMVFIPMAGKLKDRSDNEILYKEIMLEGILSIQAGENPRIIENKLNAFVRKRNVDKSGTMESREVKEINA